MPKIITQQERLSRLIDELDQLTELQFTAKGQGMYSLRRKQRISDVKHKIEKMKCDISQPATAR